MEGALMARGKRLDDEKIVKHMAKIQPKAIEYKNVGGESLDDLKKRRGTQSVATKGNGEDITDHAANVSLGQLNAVVNDEEFNKHSWLLRSAYPKIVA